MTTLAPSSSPQVVLDTNVVLDWVVFRNPHCTALEMALRSGALRWIATSAMRDELHHVLSSGRLALWHPDPMAILSAWQRYCTEVAAPDLSGPLGRFRCSDPDDQKFVDLAVARRVRWLFSRDRAVLKLGRRLHNVGVDIVRPKHWAAVDRSPN